MKILHLITRLELGGAQLNTLSCVRGLSRKNHAVVLAAGPGGFLDAEAGKIPGVRVVLLRNLRREVSPVSDLLAFMEVLKLCRNEKFDVVHTHSSKAGVIGRWAAWFGGVPVIVHTVHGWSFNDYQNPLVRRVFVLAERLTALVTAILVAVCRADIDKGIRAGIGRSPRYELIRSGIKREAFAAGPGSREKARQLLGLGEGQVVGTVSCMKPQKSPLDFVRVAELVAGKRPGTRFVIVGDGVLRRELERLVESAGLKDKFILTSWRRDVNELLPAFDVFLLTSLYEGLPRAVLEAACCERPIVATAVNGIPEVIKDGRTGFLFTPGDVETAARKVVSLLDDPVSAREMGKAAHDAVGSEFDEGEMAARLEILYQKIGTATIFLK